MSNNNFELLAALWKNYNHASNLLTKAMGGTSNEVGEFAERLVQVYYSGVQLPASSKSADIQTKDGKFIQVKSRKIERLMPTSLNVIRSWDFDYLVVVLFSKEGNILKALEIDVASARSIAKGNSHQNGDVITTSNELLQHPNAKDITNALQSIIDGNFQSISLVESNVIEHNNDNTLIAEEPKLPIKQPNNKRPEIELISSDPIEFKRMLMLTKRAKREFYYLNGKVVEEIWRADNFTAYSDIYANIQSNNKYRKWKVDGIYKVRLEVLE